MLTLVLNNFFLFIIFNFVGIPHPLHIEILKHVCLVLNNACLEQVFGLVGHEENDQSFFLTAQSWVWGYKLLSSFLVYFCAIYVTLFPDQLLSMDVNRMEQSKFLGNKIWQTVRFLLSAIQKTPNGMHNAYHVNIEQR